MLLMKYFIGLDVHSKSSTFAVINQEGQCVLRKEVPTTEKSLESVIDQIDGERHLVFEECHLAQWVYIALREKVDRLVVCNPVYLAKKQGAKTDFRDALHLAQELRTNHVSPVYHDNSHWIQLRTLVSGYLDITGEIVRFKNRLKGVFRSEAISTDENNFYKSCREKANQLSNESSKFVADNLFNQIEYLESEKEKYKDKFHRNQKTYKPIRNLMTIPGISLIRANIIVAIVCTPERFKNKHQFWGYCMLVRHIQESGGRIYGNKRVHGRRELRDCFIGAAESAMRSDSTLRDYYEALRARGESHQDAKVALARKVASLALSLLKNNETYHDDWEERLRKRTELRKNLLKK
jgi:transposase